MPVPTLTKLLLILSLFPFNQLVSASESCWKNLTSWQATFHSPSYPGNYSSNLDCHWLITVATGNTIAITINDISVEPSPGCHKDFIDVYDGPTKSSPIINTRLCGTSLSFQQRSIISSKNVILFRMHSDSERVSRGFNASYQGVCHVNFTSPYGEISSPRFPGFYTDEVACNWLIARDGYSIKVHISAVLPDNSTNCRLNYIQIQERRGSYSTILTICRHENTNITSKSPVRILYAKEKNRMLAFKAFYTMKDIDECSDQALGGYPCHQNAICINNNGSYTCVCKEGFIGDGKNCSDIDECVAQSPCHANANCINTNGSFICKCHKGYRGSGHYCLDINECMERTHSCRPGSICINKEGMFTCPCRDGFYFNRETAKCLSDVVIMNKPEESDKLSSPAVIAGIVTTVLFLAIIVIGGLYYWKKYRSEDSHISEDQEMSKYCRNRTATMDSQSYDLCNISLSSMESGAKRSLGGVTTASHEHPARLNLEDVEDYCGDIVMTSHKRQDMTPRPHSRMQTFDGLESIEV